MGDNQKNVTKMLRKILKGFLIVLGVLANILFVLGVVWILLLISMPARMPNGYSLVPVWFDRGNVSLYDPEGKEVVPAHVSGVGWCDEIVYGTHYTEDGPDRGISFIYDGKKHELKYADNALHEARDLPGYNLPKWPENLKRYDDIPDASPKVSCPGRDYENPELRRR